MTKTTLAASLLASLSAALLLACTTPPGSPEAQAAPSATPAGSGAQPAQSAPSFTSHYWRLTGAVDGSGQEIAALRTDPKRPLRLTFTDGWLGIRGGCNSISGKYTQAKDTLEVQDLVSTLMACVDSSLMRLDDEISKRLHGKLRAEIGGSADAPQLTLTAGNGDKLTFAGEPTPETRYGGPGRIEFLEVAARRVPCPHPLIPDHRCLQVREREYDANGVQKPARADWQPLYEDIQGYEHIDGQRDVVRVKRFEVKNPPADASSVAYVLDMVVESEVSDAEQPPGGKK